jgi:hypothetical protein
VAGESDLRSQKQICSWTVRYMTSETDMWLESQIYGPQKQICGWRVRYKASETDMWLESQIYGIRNIKTDIFLFTNIYSNTLVHSSPHLPVYCMGRWVRLHCFFQMGMLDMIQHFMHEILVGSSRYFTSYYNESRHLCEILKREGLVGQ